MEKKNKEFDDKHGEIFVTLRDHFNTIKELAAKVSRTCAQTEYAEEWIHSTQESFVDIIKPVNERLEKLESQMNVVLVEMPNFPSYTEK